MTIKDRLFAGSPLGFGTAPLGNMFRAIPDAVAAATLRAAWDPGTRFFDTAPFYGAGLAVDRIREVARRHGISLKAATLQFSRGHPAVAAVIPGASRPARLAEDHGLVATPLSLAPVLRRQASRFHQ